MNSIEETLWSYIDGNCSKAEHETITQLIKSNVAYREKYDELLAFNAEIAAMELDEPSMAFTYNVIETIRTENAMVPLKTTFNKRIITGVAAFFAITIFVLLVITVASVNWDLGTMSFNTNNIKVPAGIKIPEVKSFLAGPLVQGFLFFDVVLGLFLFDYYLRKRNFQKFNNPRV